VVFVSIDCGLKCPSQRVYMHTYLYDMYNAVRAYKWLYLTGQFTTANSHHCFIVLYWLLLTTIG